jgi:AraC-like DNA-binding protein
MLLKGAGLHNSVLEDPDARIPCDKFGAVMGCAMQQRPMKNVGVRLAAETSIGSFPLLDYLILTSSNIGKGMAQLARYFGLVGGPTRIEIYEDQDLCRVVVWAGDNPLSAEFTVSLNVLNLRRETDGRFQADHVSFMHQPDDVKEIEQILGCEVRAGASWSGVAINRQNWELPFRRRDPVLRELLERQANDLIGRLPTTHDIAFDVRRVLAKRIAGGDTRIDSVARELATTARTLQRRLEAAGRSYQDLVELTRKEAAERYLRDTSLPIAEVAYLLGYSEPSALHRAFKRWKGVTPQVFRQARYSAKSKSD